MDGLWSIWSRPGEGSGKEFARVTGWLARHRGGSLGVVDKGQNSFHTWNFLCATTCPVSCCLSVMKIRRMFLRICVTIFFLLVIIVAWNESPRLVGCRILSPDMVAFVKRFGSVAVVITDCCPSESLNFPSGVRVGGKSQQRACRVNREGGWGQVSEVIWGIIYNS